MGRGGRFGKYGEYKRLERLRHKRRSALPSKLSVPSFPRKPASRRQRESRPVPVQTGNQNLKTTDSPASSMGQTLLEFVTVKTGAEATLRWRKSEKVGMQGERL